MGFASSPETRDTLAAHGIRIAGYRWRWGLGLKGGTFPPHRHQNGEFVADSGDFEALPGEDVNGDSCMCALVPQYRDEAGRFAKPGLAPVFQPPATASLVTYKPEPIDWTPLAELMANTQPTELAVSLPEGSVVVNVNVPVPQVRVNAPTVNVDAPTVNVQAPPQPPAPVVTVQSPPPAQVKVAAPTVNVSPNITVKPAPVKVIRERVNKIVRFRRNNGQIESAELTEE